MIAKEVVSHQRHEWLDITSQLEACIREQQWNTGSLTVFVPHTTAAVTINENADPDVVSDLITTMDRLVPWEDNYRHLEGNSAAHVKASLLGASLTLLVIEGQLKKGTWQGVFFCECDGPRKRQYWLTFAPAAQEKRIPETS